MYVCMYEIEFGMGKKMCPNKSYYLNKKKVHQKRKTEVKTNKTKKKTYTKFSNNAATGSL